MYGAKASFLGAKNITEGDDVRIFIITERTVLLKNLKFSLDINQKINFVELSK